MLAEEILDPLGFRWTNYGVDRRATSTAVALNYVTGAADAAAALDPADPRARHRRSTSSSRSTNDPRFLTGIVPAANVVTTANELSRFFELMRRGGEIDGVRVIEPETIRRALTEQSHLEIDLSLGFPTRFSYGLMLGATRAQPLRPRHRARLRPPRLHQHARLGRSRAGARRSRC